MLPALFLYFFLEIGYLPIDSFVQYSNVYIDKIEQNTAEEVTLAAFLKWGWLEIGGQVKTYMFNVNIKGFCPVRMDYDFFARLRFTENIELGFRHFCQHPIIPYI